MEKQKQAQSYREQIYGCQGGGGVEERWGGCLGLADSNYYTQNVETARPSCMHSELYSMSYNKDMILILAGSIVFALYPFIGEKNKMTRENGILFVIVYIVYMINLVMEHIG